MKPSNLVIVVLAVLLINLGYSQNKNIDNGFLGKLYLKAGLEYINYTNTAKFKIGTGGSNKENARLLSFAVAYQYNKRLQLELQYKFTSDISYRQFENLTYYGNGDPFHHFAGGTLSANYINLRANYFVNENRREDPIYFISTLTFGIQRVNELEYYKYASRTVTVNSKFNRFILGPEAGFGIFFDLGLINFQTEFTFASRLTLFTKRRSYSENTLNFSFSPVINF